MTKSWGYVLIGLCSSVPVYFLPSLGLLSGPILGLVTLLVPFSIAHWRLAHRQALRMILLSGSTALGICSILSGWLNFLTDEWNTPQYASLLLAGHNWYSTPLHFQYVKAGSLIQATSWNVYLPLMSLVQVPYIWLDYRWFTFGLWGLLVYLVRKRYYASIALGGPYPAIVAANGFNDIVALVFLTLGFITLRGRLASVVKTLSLGLKQFANAFLFFYYILRRDWNNAGLTILASILFLLPFLLWDWKSAMCTPILDMPPNCQSAQNLTISNGRPFMNYALWPVWLVAIFYPSFIDSVRRLNQRLSRVTKFFIKFHQRIVHRT